MSLSPGPLLNELDAQEYCPILLESVSKAQDNTGIAVHETKNIASLRSVLEPVVHSSVSLLSFTMEKCM